MSKPKYENVLNPKYENVLNIIDGNEYYILENNEFIKVPIITKEMQKTASNESNGGVTYSFIAYFKNDANIEKNRVMPNNIYREVVENAGGRARRKPRRKSHKKKTRRNRRKSVRRNRRH